MKKDHKYLRYFRRYTGLIVLTIILLGFATVADLYSTHFMSNLIAEINAHDLRNIYSCACIFGILMVIKIICSFLSGRLKLYVTTNVVKAIRWNAAGTFSQATSESVHAGNGMSIISRLHDEASIYVDAVQNIVDEIARLLMGIIAIVISAYYSIVLTIVCLVILTLILLIQYFTISRMVKEQEVAKNTADDNRQFLKEVVDAFLAVKSQNLIPGLKEHFRKRNDSEAISSQQAGKTVIDNQTVSSLLLTAYQVIYLMLGGYLVSKSQLSFQAFVALYLYRFKIDELVYSILRTAKYRASASSATKRLDEIFGFIKIRMETFGDSREFPLDSSVCIQNLSYSRDEQAVLSHISMEIPSGSFVGIVGESGCGKSTLLSLISRQLSPSSGTILIGGKDISEMSKNTFTSTVKLAPQKAFLFSMTVRENLALTNPRASEAAMWEALKDCGCEDLVKAKGGLDSFISPDEVSGGEAQRLALARLGVVGSQVILLDESTSAMDANSQEIILKTIYRAISHGYTIIMVAHRLQTLKNADIIFRLDAGSVAEFGTYSELMKKSEAFRKLANSD